jgi:hypothetical protein
MNLRPGSDGVGIPAAFVGYGEYGARQPLSHVFGLLLVVKVMGNPLPRILECSVNDLQRFGGVAATCESLVGFIATQSIRQRMKCVHGYGFVPRFSEAARVDHPISWI